MRFYIKLLLIVLAASIILNACTDEEETIIEPLVSVFSVLETVPTQNSFKIDVNQTISVIFSSVIDSSSIDSTTFIVSNNVTGTFQFNDSVVLFTPNPILDTGQVYEITLTTDIQDTYGAVLEEEYIFSFRTFMPVQEGTILIITGSAFHSELLFQLENQFQQLRHASYLPLVSFPEANGGMNQQVPVLLLLPPSNADVYYFIEKGLKELVDTLISENLIEPMMIVCIENSPALDGFFYAGHYPAGGNYDTLISFSFLDYIGNILSQLGSGQTGSAISGFGMGAYGAFRAALLHPGRFTSVSAIEGPLDFDGANGNGGFIPFFQNALMEQGLTPETFKQFDSSSNWALSQLFIGGSYAFSPHDTAVNFDISHFPIPPYMIRTITERFSIDDTTTLIEGVYGEDNFNFAFHLPFDGFGNIYPFIWGNYWLPNNLENILNPIDNQLDGKDIFLGLEGKSDFGYYEQSQSWISTLSEYNYALDTIDYSLISSEEERIRKQLTDILIFHSKSFNK